MLFICSYVFSLNFIILNLFIEIFVALDSMRGRENLFLLKTFNNDTKLML
jgi:hypothetical protein